MSGNKQYKFAHEYKLFITGVSAKFPQDELTAAETSLGGLLQAIVASWNMQHKTQQVRFSDRKTI